MSTAGTDPVNGAVVCGIPIVLLEMGTVDETVEGKLEVDVGGRLPGIVEPPVGGKPPGGVPGGPVPGGPEPVGGNPDGICRPI